MPKNTNGKLNKTTIVLVSDGTRTALLIGENYLSRGLDKIEISVEAGNAPNIGTHVSSVDQFYVGTKEEFFAEAKNILNLNEELDETKIVH